MKKDPVRGRKAVTQLLQLVQADVARLYLYEHQLIQPIHQSHANTQVPKEAQALARSFGTAYQLTLLAAPILQSGKRASAKRLASGALIASISSLVEPAPLCMTVTLKVAIMNM